MTVRLDATAITRADAEDFLYEEAALLDRWDLDGWLKLFDERSSFLVPSTDVPEGDRASNQFLVADDYDLIKARVKRLKSKYAHAENPRSMTLRNIANVRVLGNEDDAVRVMANFQIYRERDGYTDPYIGRYDHLLTMADGRWVFRRRKAVLAYQIIRPGGRLSFIL